MHRRKRRVSKREKGKAGPWEKETTRRKESHRVRPSCGTSSSREDGFEEERSSFQKECVATGLEPGQAQELISHRLYLAGLRRGRAPALAFRGRLRHRHEYPVPAVPRLTLPRGPHEKLWREGRRSGAATAHLFSHGLLLVLNICYQSWILIIAFLKPRSHRLAGCVSHPSRPLLTHRPQCGPGALQGNTLQRCRGGSAAASLTRTTPTPFSKATAMLLPPRSARRGCNCTKDQASSCNLRRGTLRWLNMVEHGERTHRGAGSSAPERAGSVASPRSVANQEMQDQQSQFMHWNEVPGEGVCINPTCLPMMRVLD